MTVLIDGHNLIAHMPGLSLADPDDEAKLVMRLRAYNARTRHKIVVVFDHGVPGGWSRELSTGPVKVVFAGSHTDADRVLIERIRSAKDKRGLTVVSSDSQVRQVVEENGARAVSADQFAAKLLAQPAPRETADDVHLSPSEVDEWMQVFKQAPQRKRRPAEEKQPGVLTDPQGHAIRLTDERLAHILERPEMQGQEKRIAETIARPSVVVLSRHDDPSLHLYHRWFDQTPVASKYLVVVVKHVGQEAFIVTAFFTKREKKGVRVWPP